MKQRRVIAAQACWLVLLLACRQVPTACASRVILQDSPSPSPSPSPDSESPSPDYSPEAESPSPSPSPEYSPEAESPSPSPSPEYSPEPESPSPSPSVDSPSPSPASPTLAASPSPSPSPEPTPSPTADSSCGLPAACNTLLSGAVQLSGQSEAMLAALLAKYAYAPEDGSDWETTARESVTQLGAAALQTIDVQAGGTFIAHDTQAIVVDGGSKIYVAYRGTEALSDWITNGKFDPKEVPGLGMLHTGFTDAQNVAHTQVVDAITAMQAGSSKPIVAIGHSLGGALAMIFAARLQQSQPGSVVAVYTFGSPAVGDAAWAQAYDALGLSGITFRYINFKDVVPRVASADAHVGQQYYLDGVERSGASMCALSAPSSTIPDYCTETRWANGTEALGTLLSTVAVGQFACGATSTHDMDAYIQALFNLCLDTCAKAAVQACVPALQAPATLYKVVVATSCESNAASFSSAVNIYMKDAQGTSTPVWPLNTWGDTLSSKGLPPDCSNSTYVADVPQTLVDTSTWKLYLNIKLDLFGDGYKPDFIQVTANGATSKFCLVDQPPVDPAYPGWMDADGEYLFEPCQ